MGAIGSDGRFARFPSYEAGRKAQEKLLFESKGYRDLTLGQAIRRWAPGSENNVPAYIKAMGGDDPSKRMADYSPEQRGRLLDAMQAHEGWRPGTVTGGGGNGSPIGSGPLAGLGGTSKAVDNARSLIGMGSRQAAAALGSRMTPGQWCADFVNGSLKSANIKGVNSSIATSFLGWGQQVLDGVKAGDVVVTHRGRGQGQPGGHVGLATGETRMKDGRLQYQTVSGNHGNRVGLGWEDASKVAVRRAQESVAQSQDLAKRAGAVNLPQGSIGGAGANTAGSGLGAGDAATSAPTRGGGLGQSTPLKMAPVGSAGGRGMGGGGPAVNAPITINGHNKDPQALAGEVQRHLQDSMNRRTHDYDGFA